MTALFGSVGESADLDARQETLDHLIDDINGFLGNWVQRLDCEVRAWQASSTSAHVSQTRMDEFEQQKRQWETSRMQEAQLMREQSDHLTAAWLQLEAEQRRFLQIKQEHRGQAPSVSVHNKLPRATESVVPAARARDAAFRQFRQLRQEVSAAAPSISRY